MSNWEVIDRDSFSDPVIWKKEFPRKGLGLITSFGKPSPGLLFGYGWQIFVGEDRHSFLQGEEKTFRQAVRRVEETFELIDEEVSG